jgi:sugar lactone lactonase YvrE
MSIRRGFRAAVALQWLAALALGGCSSSSGPTAPTTGSLTVTITAPAGVTPSVAVTGPGGYHRTLSATDTLSGLAVGSYTVTAATVRGANPIVATVYTATVTGGAATVVAGATAAASVSYAARPGSGALWVANLGGNTVGGYSAAQLAASTAAAPATALGSGASRIAFDAGGNLWVTDVGDRVVEFAASQLATSGRPTPAVTLSADGHGSLFFAEGLAFDASGNLWVVNPSNTVVEFAANQLAASGSPTPAVTLSDTGGSLNTPVNLAFDVSGNLWIANHENSTLVEFAKSQLGASGSPTPAVTLSDDGSGSLSGPIGLAFDASGNLWVASNRDSTVVEFSASQLTASGGPTPAITLSATGGSLDSPEGLAFDASGNLWVTNTSTTGHGTVVEFAANQLATSGAATPNVTVSGSAIKEPVGLAFDPAAANLPLK